MNIQILDGDDYRAITPSALSAFATSKGWAKSESFGPYADVYVGNGRPSLVIPHTNQIGDYAAVVSQLIKDFAEYTEQDALVVYSDLDESNFDAV